jgi:hypothetical protein
MVDQQGILNQAVFVLVAGILLKLGKPLEVVTNVNFTPSTKSYHGLIVVHVPATNLVDRKLIQLIDFLVVIVEDTCGVVPSSSVGNHPVEFVPLHVVYLYHSLEYSVEGYDATSQNVGAAGVLSILFLARTHACHT